MQIAQELFRENQQALLNQIKKAQYKIYKLDNIVGRKIFTGEISNNLKFIIATGSDKLLKIWNYQTNAQKKSIICKFTDDSKLLYVGTIRLLYQFNTNIQFKELCKMNIGHIYINNIYCITNTLILTSYRSIIFKTDFHLKQKIFIINAGYINGMNYNRNLNIIVTGSNDTSIQLWNANDGKLIMEKHNTDYNRVIFQVLFIDNNSIISLDKQNQLVIWHINYQQNKLQQIKAIENSGFNISLVLSQQYILSIGNQFIKVFTINGQLVRIFEHLANKFTFFQTIQHNSMKAVLIQGYYKLQICKIDMD